MPFRKMEDRSSGGGGLINLVLKSDSGAIWLRNRLRKGEKPTEVRFLPIFTETGAEDEVLNPDFVAGGSSHSDQALSGVFCKVPLLYMYRNGDHWLPDAVQDQDTNGEDRPMGKGPARIFAQRIADKMLEQKELLRNRQQLHLSPQIVNGLTVNYVRPTYLVQCMGLAVDGQRRVGPSGAEIPIYPAVFAIPQGARNKFFQKLTTRRNPQAPLSATNNTFGDCFTVAHGRSVFVERFEGTPVTYDLSISDQEYPLDLEWARQAWMPWDSILNIPTVEDIMHALMELCEPELLDYAFRGGPYMKYLPDKFHGLSSHIPEAVKVAPAASVSAATPPAPVYSRPVAPHPGPVSRPPVSVAELPDPGRPTEPPEEAQEPVDMAAEESQQPPEPPPRVPGGGGPPAAFGGARGAPPSPPTPGRRPAPPPPTAAPAALGNPARYQEALRRAQEASAAAAGAPPPSSPPSPGRMPSPPRRSPPPNQ